MEKEVVRELAEQLARDIFNMGDMPKRPVQRIVLMGGTYPNLEIDQGGLCEASLSRCIENGIIEHLTPSKEGERNG